MGQKISMALMSGGRLFKKMVIGLMAGVILAAGSYAVVQAAGYEGTVFGRDSYRGYFDNEYDDFGLPVISDGIPSDVDSVNDFMYFLTQTYSDSTEQNKTGVAFIVDTMLGREAGSTRTITSDDFKDLSASLDARQASNGGEGIKWGIPISNDDGSGCINSYYQGDNPNDPNDDAFFSECKSLPGIKILDDGKKAIYQLWYICANPVGELSPLPPPPSWTISTTTGANSDTVPQGGTITWSHTVSNNGLDNTDADVSYYYQNSAGFGDSNTGGNGILPSGSPKLIPSRSFSSPNTTVPLTTPAGTQFCRKTIATPGGKGGVAAATSEKCVTVTGVGTVTANTCRPWVLAVDVPTDVHTGKLVYVNITGTDTLTKATKTWRTNKSSLNITSDCTNGDVWNFHFVTDSYVYYHYDSCDGGDYCHWVHHDRRTTNTWDLNGQGPCFDYDLTAAVNPIGNYDVEVNSLINAKPTITSKSHTGNNHTKSKLSQWEVTQLIVPPSTATKTYSVPKLSNVNSNIEPCTYFKSKADISDCTVIANGPSNNTVFSNSTNPSILSGDAPPSSLRRTIGDYPAGTKVCFAYSVKAASSDPSYSLPTPDNIWNHSALDQTKNCIIVVKKPKVQIWGGDLSVGKIFTGTSESSFNSGANVVTTNSIKNMNSDVSSNANLDLHAFGSWVEYGIFASNSINGMASGSAFAGPQGLSVSSSLTSLPVCDYSTLSFANAANSSGCKSSGTIGNYTNATNARPIPDVAKAFPVITSGTNKTPTFPSSFDNLASGVYTANGDVSIPASTIRGGKWYVINAPNANITITGNINYINETLKSIDDIPQVVIIANNINIDDTAPNIVTNIDAWLIAKPINSNDTNGGAINTCYNVNPPLTANMCSQPLIVNGPVMASHLYLRRTAGSGTRTASGDPAETFNLRADAYLWSFARATGSGRVQTVYTTELPPRF